MSHDDFCKCTFPEFESICKAWREMNENMQREEWERMRTLAAICIQPHVRKKITPRQLMPLPWDKKLTPKKVAPRMSSEERLRRFDDVIRRMAE